MTEPRDPGVLIATDLDRTMIYSRRSAGDRVDAELQCVEHYNGGPLSYMTSDAVIALRALATRNHVVPATTRTKEQFRRIELPGAPWRYAVTSNGGNILVDGRPDARWRAAVAARMDADGADLETVTAELTRRISSDWVDTFRTADDLFCYLVVRPDDVPTDFVGQWGRWCADHGWSVSQQGRKIYTMPTAVCKSRAVAEIRTRLVADGELYGNATLLAAGDGWLDGEMLTAADAAIRPRHGELEALGWQRPNVTVTESAGAAAGEEILRWFAVSAAVGPVERRSHR